MPAKTAHLRALVLQRDLAGESHQRLRLLEPESGLCTAFFRQGKKPGSEQPDIFDLGEFFLDASRDGNSWFVREFRLERRLPGLAHHYARLQAAADYAQFLCRNAIHCHDPASVFDAAERTLVGLESADKPEAALLKGYYLFARQEGWPVRESWLNDLPPEHQQVAIEVLNTPLKALRCEPQIVSNLCRALKNWLAARDEVEIS